MKTLIYDNLLSEDECNFIINYYNNNEQHATQFYNVYPLNLNNDIDFLDTKLTNVSKEFNAEVDWVQIVKWPVGASQPLHFDYASDKTVLSSITYLNDDFEGGQTYYEEGTIFKPKKGRGLFFDGQYYKHGVTEVKNNTRYVVAAWYKTRLDNFN